jgi:two-component system nitrogen regulation sensor histidine kinase NtrY
MVDEFSSFARLPKPMFRSEDPVDLARQALFLQEVARPDISFAFSAEPDLGPIACDRHQFGQAMTNVLKNAVEAIETRSKLEPHSWRGRIAVDMRGSGDLVCIAITDNGIGLPQDRERIVEPYVTTREKGTGLGLAIVNKIVEEHGGEMTFASAEGGGTCVTLSFACDPMRGRGRNTEAAE